jgi:Zn finger protein HypA/HybF involved in hydrogenase expression
MTSCRELHPDIGRRPSSIGATVGGWLWIVCVAAASSGCDKMIFTNSNDDGAATASGALTREEHGMYFPIGSGSYHPTETCDDCHGGFDSFKQFTCMSCHAHAADVAAGRHTSIPEFQAESSACFKCHPNGREAPISVADHSAKYFPIDSGPHSSLQCTDCHTWTTTSRPFTCMGCHDHDQAPTDMIHASVTAYRYDSYGCYGCHPQ